MIPNITEILGLLNEWCNFAEYQGLAKQSWVLSSVIIIEITSKIQVVVPIFLFTILTVVTVIIREYTCSRMISYKTRVIHQMWCCVALNVWRVFGWWSLSSISGFAGMCRSAFLSRLVIPFRRVVKGYEKYSLSSRIWIEVGFCHPLMASS